MAKKEAHRGRKRKGEEKRTVRLALALSPSEAERIARAAGAIPPATWARSELLRDVEEHERRAESFPTTTLAERVEGLGLVLDEVRRRGIALPPEGQAAARLVEEFRTQRMGKGKGGRK